MRWQDRKTDRRTAGGREKGVDREKLEKKKGIFFFFLTLGSKKTPKTEKECCQISISCLGSLLLCMRKKQSGGIFKPRGWLWEYSAGPCGYTNFPLMQPRWSSLHFRALKAQTDGEARQSESGLQGVSEQGGGGNRGHVGGFVEVQTAEG